MGVNAVVKGIKDSEGETEGEAGFHMEVESVADVQVENLGEISTLKIKKIYSLLSVRLE